MLPYCHSRALTVRQWTREVRVGHVGIGGENPIRVQSMTTTDTMDIEATVRQSIALAEAGSEIVRITAPNTKAAKALGDIRKRLNAAKINVPLVADIHFTPNAAIEAAEHVEKVRINPGNYADRKKFKIREYSDDQYEEELERLYQAFSPIVIKCRELGRAMRIGTNHGSLSDRIMNRYGDTPLGMVESALEFIRICEDHGFRDIVLSMKASNPKVMIQAYRLAVAKMKEEGMAYPLHLGVTEAGDGEDARIKSTIGIGSLLYDGLGDTIRVSLTEDPVYEIPVARELADRAHRLWSRDEEGNVIYADRPEAASPAVETWRDSIDPYEFTPQPARPITLNSTGVQIGGAAPPAVFLPGGSASKPDQVAAAIRQAKKILKDARFEGVLLDPGEDGSWEGLAAIRSALTPIAPLFLLNADTSNPEALRRIDSGSSSSGWIAIHLEPESWENLDLEKFVLLAEEKAAYLALTFPSPEAPNEITRLLQAHAPLFILSLRAERNDPRSHPLGQFRRWIEFLKEQGIEAPVWIRHTPSSAISQPEKGQDLLIEASLLAGPLLCDGIGSAISIENAESPARSASLAFNVLQGAKSRISRTEFVACPSCGRTLFDLQSTTRKIRQRTEHLKGVTIAVMGCIVNGPGEMADADFGYVGGAPGKVNLYVGKTPVKYNIPEAQAVDALVDLIKSEGKWNEPRPEELDSPPHDLQSIST